MCSSSSGVFSMRPIFSASYFSSSFSVRRIIVPWLIMEPVVSSLSSDLMDERLIWYESGSFVFSAFCCCVFSCPVFSVCVGCSSPYCVGIGFSVFTFVCRSVVG